MMNILLINDSVIILKMFETTTRKIQAKLFETINLVGVDASKYDIAIIMMDINDFKSIACK